MMRRLRTLVLIISAMAFAVVGGVAVASALLPTPPSLVGQEASEPAGTDYTLGSTVADPDGGQDWTVRTYPSKTHWTCAEAGRTDGTTFGRVDTDDKLRPLELPEPAVAPTSTRTGSGSGSTTTPPPPATRLAQSSSVSSRRT